MSTRAYASEKQKQIVVVASVGKSAMFTLLLLSLDVDLEAWMGMPCETIGPVFFCVVLVLIVAVVSLVQRKL